MITVLALGHVVIALLLIALVLMQDSKSTMGAFGSAPGSSSLFGATGATNFLVKATRVIAILFAVSCLSLAYMAGKKRESVMDSHLPTAPLTAPAASAPGATATETAPAATVPAAQPASPAKAPEKK